MSLGVKDALDAFQAQNAAADRLWAYFSAVSLAVAGYAVSQGAALGPLKGGAIALGYLAFCINNNIALGAAQALLVSLARAAREAARAEGLPLDIRALAVGFVRGGQAVMAAAVLAGLIAVGGVLG
ncbi:hypothetical protein [Mangrovicoccus algicola]|uniref:Uncharacterized protein n=1 Tax=Mangrovicoccus algicola TaxID=2771008 RepID=A0A8J7CUR5_9RHOB|nr:hypothetical protein [Mangrovicoccus algicola]MBE3637844.1 hypothetical protein [Mangrovicoccus algicola]